MNKKLLAQLCNTPGVSGNEHPVQKVVINELREHCDELSVDRMGNVTGYKRATAKSSKEPARLMIAAHADEIGFMVMDVNDKGFIRVCADKGDVVNSVVIGSQIRIFGTEEVIGVLVPGPGQHEARLKSVWVDTARDAEWVRARITHGDVGVLNVPFSQINDKTVCSRNFDNRMGVFCMLEAAKRIKDTTVDIYFVSTVQEEVGVRGAVIVSNTIKPDIGLAIDGGRTMDPFEGRAQSKFCKPGDGAAIYEVDRITFSSQRLICKLHEVADDAGISYQRNLGGATDSSAMQRSGVGAHVTTLGVPTRYMHTPMQLCNTDDAEALISLIVTFAERAHEMELDDGPWPEFSLLNP